MMKSFLVLIWNNVEKLYVHDLSACYTLVVIFFENKNQNWSLRYLGGTMDDYC